MTGNCLVHSIVLGRIDNASQHFIVQSLDYQDVIFAGTIPDLTTTLFLPVVRIAVSSVKVAMVYCSDCGKSYMYIRYKMGPRTLPCGIPAQSSLNLEYAFSYLTMKNLSEIYEFKGSV